MRTSWDLFDTLWARRSVHPFTDKHNPQPGREENELIPIAENVARVRPDDLIVSDFYLSKAWLQDQLFKVCGLTNEIVVSEDGKATGKVWRELRAQGRLPELHIGDSPVTDVQSAQAAGIATEQVYQWRPTAAEARMLDRPSTKSLGQLMREVRLGTWSDDKTTRQLQLAQSQANFPMLYLASHHLYLTAERLGKTSILVSGRDGRLWNELLNTLGYRDVSYFRSSRVARIKSSASYLKYVQDLAGDFMDNALLVDLCGTGWSLRLLADALPGSSIYLLARYPGQLLTDYEQVKMPSHLLDGFCIQYASENLESANYDIEPMTVDVKATDQGHYPVFHGQAYDSKKVKVSHEAFHKCLAAMPHYDLGGIDAIRENELPPLVLESARELDEYDEALSFASGDKRAEEQWIMSEINKQA